MSQMAKILNLDIAQKSDELSVFDLGIVNDYSTRGLGRRIAVRVIPWAIMELGLIF